MMTNPSSSKGTGIACYKCHSKNAGNHNDKVVFTYRSKRQCFPGVLPSIGAAAIITVLRNGSLSGQSNLLYMHLHGNYVTIHGMPRHFLVVVSSCAAQA